MDSLFNVVILASVTAHLVLLIYVQIRHKQVRAGWLWLSLTILLSALAATMHLLPEALVLAPRFGRGFGLVLTLAAMTITLGALVISDVRRTNVAQNRRIWLMLGIAWLGSLLLTGFMSESVEVAKGEWLVTAFATPNAFSLATLLGLGLMSIVLLGMVFHAFYIALLPEVANRALFWVLDIAVVLIGIILMISGSTTLASAAMLTLLCGITGAVYAQVSYRVFDIRNSIGRATRTILLISITAGAIFAALYVVNRDNTVDWLQLSLLALITAIIYMPLRALIEWILDHALRGRRPNTVQAARKYSQQVSKAVELDQLMKVATDTLNEVLHVRRSGLLLVNDTGDENGQIELLVMPGGAFAEMKGVRGYLAKNGPVYQRLAADHASLLQFDLEFSPLFRETTESEKQFIANLGMSAFAPIVVENVTIGILACGSKVNDAPFYPRDLELLMTMANQTGVALRNARLVADLRHLNRSMQSLNAELEATNQQMEKLDSVKTDFVTIASHELRTPLAQIRGYTDIIDALNQQGMLDQDQISGMVGNLRKAAERMEELISAMLDVSQLDVDAMDLRFTQTTPESVIRLSIEPLTDAIKQRKLTLSARGLRGLPPIEADMQRLVQAFRNIVVNAIKFTPDGGRIEITANLQPANQTGEKDQILVAISDTGVGIAKENLELIFQKFFRAYDPGLHSTGTYKFMGAGPGLGLTIAKGVIEGHGGKIWAESPGHNMQSCPGTIFYVLLPVSPPEGAKRVMSFEAKEAEKA